MDITIDEIIERTYKKSILIYFLFNFILELLK